MKTNLKTYRAKMIKVTKDNYPVLKQIVSKSGLSFHELYYVNNGYYRTCLEIFDFPKGSVRGFMNFLYEIPDVYVTLTCSYMDEIDFENRIGRYVENEQNKFQFGRFKFFERKKTQQEMKVLNSFHSQVIDRNGSFKTISLRLYLKAKTVEELNDLYFTIEKKLLKIRMKGYIQINNLQEDYRALTAIEETVSKEVSGATVADMLFYNNANYIDKNTMLLGTTQNGLYAPNVFDLRYSSYSAFAMGTVGSGKSALFKSLCESLYFRGNATIHIADIEGETIELAKVLDIPVVKFGEDKTVNLCQIFFVDNEKQDSIIRENDVQAVVSLIVRVFQSLTNFDRKETPVKLANLITQMYDKYLYKDFEEIKSDEWFTIQDIYNEVKIKWETKDFEPVEANDYHNMFIGLQSLVNRYGYLFNKKTTINFDLTKSLVFDLSFLKIIGDNFVKSAYMDLVNSYVSRAVYLNRRKNEKYMQENKINVSDVKEIPYIHVFYLLETMQYAESRDFLSGLTSLLKFQRKAFSGTFMEFHSKDDVMKTLENNGDLLGQLFDLCAHKYIGIMNAKALVQLPSLISNCTEQDIHRIGRFRNINTKQFLAIHEDNKVFMKSRINDYQKNIYKGGVAKKV